MPALHTKLKGLERSRPDSALYSPAYYALTGRKGLFIHSDKNSLQLSCRHPNFEDGFLVFPELGDSNFDLTLKVLKYYSEQGKYVSLARHSYEDIHAISHHIKERSIKNIHGIYIIEETLMDWAYPVQIISPKHVHERRGDKFQNLRTAYNNFISSCPHALTIRLKDCSNPYKMMRYVLKTWEAQMVWRDRDEIGYDDYYNYLFKMAVEAPEHIDGFIIFDSEYPIAISLWDTDEPKHCVGLSNICNTHYKGLSAHIMTETCRILYEQGVETLNMGGSETKDLNEFKERTFRPQLSLQIHSAQLAQQNFIPRQQSLEVFAAQ